MSSTCQLLPGLPQLQKAASHEDSLPPVTEVGVKAWPFQLPVVQPLWVIYTTEFLWGWQRFCCACIVLTFLSGHSYSPSSTDVDL